MLTIILQGIGAFIFITGILILRKILRENPVIEAAENTSRIGHFLYCSGFLFPQTIGIFYPGLTHFDETLSIRPLPFQSAFFVFGVFLFIPGIYLVIASSKALKRFGKGFPAFKLTKQIVENDIYRQVRNPMSLGYYLTCVGISLMAGSTYLTFGSLLVVIPFHIFYIKYFEEIELEIRYGQSYLQYKQNVPFLLPRIY